FPPLSIFYLQIWRTSAPINSHESSELARPRSCYRPRPSELSSLLPAPKENRRAFDLPWTASGTPPQKSDGKVCQPCGKRLAPIRICASTRRDRPGRLRI